eukprot:3249484-Rhodomonas_salina.1
MSGTELAYGDVLPMCLCDARCCIGVWYCACYLATRCPVLKYGVAHGTTRADCLRNCYRMPGTELRGGVIQHWRKHFGRGL